MGDVREAAARYGAGLSKSPVGGRGHVVRSTLIHKEDRNLIIDTPFVSSSVPILKGSWGTTVAVNAKDLSAVLEQLSKQWSDVGGDKAEVWLEATKGALTILWTDEKSTRSRTIPAGKG